MTTPPPTEALAPAKPVPPDRAHEPGQACSYAGPDVLPGRLGGGDSLIVKYTESGETIRFSYRVVEPEKAAALNDRNAEPSLIDPQAGVKLVVPQMEMVGKLRQSCTPIAGESYWMAFSNRGRRVRPGNRVTVEIGHFRADGLVVA